MESFILDTNIFFNMEAGSTLGKNTNEVIVNLTNFAKKLKKKKQGVFYMTPSAVSEFLSFFKDKDQQIIKELLSVINIESPNLSKEFFSGSVFYKLIEDIRLRSYRGLNIAEEEIKAAAFEFSKIKTEGKKDFQIKIGSFINSFRERYRKATRVGFLDSTTDLELIILARQKQGFLVTADEGVLFWGRMFGVKEMPFSVFAKRLEFLLQPR